MEKTDKIKKRVTVVNIFHRAKSNIKRFFRAVYNFPFLIRYPFFRHIKYLDANNKTKRDRTFSYSTYDCLLPGWKKAFGKKMAKDIKKELSNTPKEFRNSFEIMYIKEKYGTCRIEMNAYTNTLMDISHKYDLLSECVCQFCGKPAHYATNGWVGFYCKDCLYKDYKQNMKRKIKYAKRNNKYNPNDSEYKIQPKNKEFYKDYERLVYYPKTMKESIEDHLPFADKLEFEDGSVKYIIKCNEKQMDNYFKYLYCELEILEFDKKQNEVINDEQNGKK